MGPRTACLLANEEMVDVAKKLREELSKDFMENSLEKCPSCSCGFDEDVARKIHVRLMSVYADLSEIFKIVQENQDKKDN